MKHNHWMKQHVLKNADYSIAQLMGDDLSTKYPLWMREKMWEFYKDMRDSSYSKGYKSGYDKGIAKGYEIAKNEIMNNDREGDE